MSTALLARQEVNLCELTNFEANTNFYGFGVRLGIYLQWFSSWIANTLNPDDASSNHEENSIFVLAIAIALVLAFEGDQLRVSEAYILMLMCVGFFAIVLSTWGIRLHLLRPGAVHVSPLFWHGNRINNQIRTTRFANLPNGPKLNAMANYYLTPRQMPLSQSGNMKPTGLSWAGAVWRSLIALFVISLNLYLWFSYDPDVQDIDPNCRPTIYFFGAQKITSGLRTFFIVILLAIGTLIFQLLIQMISVVYFLIIKALINPILDLLHLTSLKVSLLNLIHRRLQLANHAGVVPAQAITWLHIRSALFALCAKKAAPAAMVAADNLPHVHPRHQQQANNDRQGFRLSLTLVLLYHLFLLTTMALFIAFIEMTIQINNMQGAYVIKSTSELIPFVIGLISMLNTIRQLLLEWYEEDHPNEDNVHFVITGSLSEMSLLGLLVSLAVRPIRWFTDGRSRSKEEGIVGGGTQEFDGGSGDGNELSPLPPIERVMGEGSQDDISTALPSSSDGEQQQRQHFKHG